MNKFLRGVFFPLLATLTFIFFLPSLSYYFFQDDWFVLAYVHNLKLAELWRIFQPINDVIYYRPLGMQLYFYFAYQLFELKPFGYHLISFTFHLANVFLISLISFQIFRNKLSSALSSFYYAIAPFHFMTLSWLSLTWNNIGTFFIFASIYCHLKYFYNSRKLYLIFSIILFIIAGFSTEFFISSPFIFTILGCLKYKVLNKQLIKKIFITSLPSYTIILIYLIFRFILFRVPAYDSYSIKFDLAVFKNIVWYGLWLTGIPQEVKYQILIYPFKLTNEFTNAAGNLLLPTFITWFAFTIAAFLSFLSIISKRQLIYVILISFIFIIGIAPVMFIPNHTFPYYLNVSSLALVLFIAYTLSNIKSTTFVSKILFMSLTILWTTLSILNLTLEKKMSWLPIESEYSKNVAYSVFMNQYIKADHLLIINDQNNARQALMDQHALKVLTNNDEAKTFYMGKNSFNIFDKKTVKSGALIILLQ